MPQKLLANNQIIQHKMHNYRTSGLVKQNTCIILTFSDYKKQKIAAIIIKFILLQRFCVDCLLLRLCTVYFYIPHELTYTKGCFQLLLPY